MGAIVIAEGIESPETLETLEVLGLRYGQGFHFAHPAALEELALGTLDRAAAPL